MSYVVAPPNSATGQPQQATPAVEQDSRLDALDGIRFLAALGVLFWHYQHFWYQNGELVGFVRESQPFYPYLHWMYDHTVHSIQVFWCLSGYIFYWKYADWIAAGSISARKFFVLRFSRLYPLHIVTFAIVALLQPIHRALTQQDFVYQNNDLFHAVLHLFMASNWGFQKSLTFNGPIWSVSVEVLVYALFFVMLRRFGINLWMTLLLIVLAAIAYLSKIENAVFQCIVCFYMGALAVILGRSAFATARPLLVRNVVVLLLVLIPATGIALNLFQTKLFIHFLVVFYTPLLMFLLAKHCVVPVALRPAVAVAGNATFSSYLIHFPIQLMLVIGFAWAGLPLPRESAWFFALFFGGTLLLSIVVYRYFELPAQRWVRKRLG